MLTELGQDELVLVGGAHGLLNWLADHLPPRTVVVVEEPDVIERRDLTRLARRMPVISRVVPHEYQTGLDPAALVAAEPVIRAAKLVVPGLEYAVGAAARLAEHLGLPGSGVEAADIFSDKHRMRLLAARAGIANPDFRLVSTAAEAEAFLDHLGHGRCVLKPTRRAGSLGVQIVEDRAQIAAAWAATAWPDEPPEATTRGLPTAVLVEQALLGPEYSVELLVAGGGVRFGNVTEKRVLGGRFPVETGHTVPADVPADRLGDLLGAAERLSRAAGFDTGVLHSEWIVADGVPTLVECAARLPGDGITVLISMAYEFRFIEAYLRLLRGERPDLPTHPTSAAAIEFLTAGPGTVTAVDGVPQARRVPGVLDVQVDVAPGAPIAPVTSSRERIGQVLAWGATPAEAENAARKAADTIRVRV